MNQLFNFIAYIFYSLIDQYNKTIILHHTLFNPVTTIAHLSILKQTTSMLRTLSLSVVGMEQRRTYLHPSLVLGIWFWFFWTNTSMTLN